VSFKTFRWLWNEPLNKLPLAMKHIAWGLSGFQTHSKKFGTTETVRAGCGLGGRARRVRSQRQRARYLKILRVRGWRFKVCGCGAGADKKFQPAQDSTVYTFSISYAILMKQQWKVDLDQDHTASSLHITVLRTSVPKLHTGKTDGQPVRPFIS